MADEAGKLIEEVKLYWNIQLATAGILGYMGTTIKELNLQSFVVSFGAILLLSIGALYNFVGNYYVFVEGERRDDFWEKEENLVTPSLAAIYLVVSGMVGGICLLSLYLTLAIDIESGITRSKIASAAVGFFAGAFFNWFITAAVFESLYRKGSERYRSYMKRVCRWYLVDSSPKP